MTQKRTLPPAQRGVRSFQVVITPASPGADLRLTWHPLKRLHIPASEHSTQVWERLTAAQASSPSHGKWPRHTTTGPHQSTTFLGFQGRTKSAKKWRAEYPPPRLSAAKPLWRVTSSCKTSVFCSRKAAVASVSLLKGLYSLERDVKKTKYGTICNAQIHSGFFKWRALEKKKKFHVFWERRVCYFFSCYLLLYLLSSTTF